MHCSHLTSWVPLLLAAALSAPGAPRGAGAQQQAGEAARPSAAAEVADQVVLNVTVTDERGRFVIRPDKGAFTAYDNKVKQDITLFDYRDLPASVGIVFDVSKSMTVRAPQWAKDVRWASNAKEALLRLVSAGNEENEYFVMGFNGGVEPLSDWTRDRAAVAAAVDKLFSLSPKDGTAFYDACRAGLEKVMRAKHGKRVIVLVSDGEDVGSKSKKGDVSRLLRESGALVYAVAIRSDNDRAWRLKTSLEEFCADSGGFAYYPSKPDEINQSFERIALELRSQYLIGYKPSTLSAEKKWHSVKVEVAPLMTDGGKRRLYVRTRSGYFAGPKPTPN